MKINRKQIALIHIAKSQLGMSDDIYRSFLFGFGVESSKNIPAKKFDAVVKELERLGFVSTVKKRPKPVRKSKDLLLAKIDAMIKDMDLPSNYVDGMAKKMFNIDSVRFCHAKQLHKITAALTYHQKRQGKKNG
jgi:phage gp16-like protein